MPIKMPMDQELYDAAMKIIEVIEQRLIENPRRIDNEEILGSDLADAYSRWQSIAVAKYASTPDATIEDDAPEERLDGRRHNRPPRPKKNHVWKGRAVLPKR